MASTSLTDYKTPQPWLILAAFIVVVVGVGGLIGTQSIPGAWYQGLAKPPFNPPNWIFGPVWFVLYVMIAIAGWRMFMLDRRSISMTIWYAQMLLNWAWSPLWFIAHLIWPAFAVITLIWLSIVAFIVTARPRDKAAAWLFVPYLAWVSFAAALNFSIGILN